MLLGNKPVPWDSKHWVQADLFYFSSDVSMFSLPPGAFHAFES